MATFGWLRKTANLAVGASILLTSATLPMLDRDMFLTGQRIEQEHSPSGCAYVHHHVFCVQLAGSRWIATAPRPASLLGQVVDYPDDAPAQVVLAAAPLNRPNSRAPPSA